MGSMPSSPTKIKIMDIKEDRYQRICKDEFRTKRWLSLFGFIIVDGLNDGDFYWTGKWFKFVTIKQQKCRERYAGFDDGWNYQYYWKPWETKWYFTEITKK